MGATARDDVPISTAVDGCGRSFLSLAEALRKPSRFADQIAPDSILDEFDRFKLWAGNIAAHRKGRRSLDYRLRDAAQLKAETHSLLASLMDALNTAFSIAQGLRLPWDEETFTDSDSDSESSDEGSVHNLQGDTELRQLFARTKSLITSLMRLSMAIREPAPNRQARSIDKSHFEQHDMWHVQAKFPDAPEYLTERLGRAISSRRQYLTYREVHHDKLKKDIDKLGLEAATTEFTTNSTEATELQRTDSLAIAEDVDDSVSMTSYATSVNASLRAPGLPKESREQDYYNCPICFNLVSIHTEAAWKRHVYQDLHPYCCTVEDCTTADRLYDSRHAWFAHESEAHYSKFQCVEGCSKTFEREQEFETHVRSTHLEFAAAEVYAALKKVSCRASSISELRPCQLCGKLLTLRAMQKHLGHHHEQLALFALPANLDDIEDERELEERKSEEEEEGRELSDSSDVSEPDNITDGPSFIDPETLPLDIIKDALRRRNLYDEEEIERLAQNRSSAVVDYAIQLWLLDDQNRRRLSSSARQDQIRTRDDVLNSDGTTDDHHFQDHPSNEVNNISHHTVHDNQLPATPPPLTQDTAKEDAMLEKLKALLLGKEEAERKKEAERLAKVNPSDATKAPLKFKDALGRKFSFPWHLCKTWKGMEELIKQAFLHVDILGTHVDQGHYDLVGPDGGIILPLVWETIVQPDWSITMHMWPMPESLREEEMGTPLPPPPPPPPVGTITAGDGSSYKPKKKAPPGGFFAWAAGGTARNRAVKKSNLERPKGILMNSSYNSNSQSSPSSEAPRDQLS